MLGDCCCNFFAKIEPCSCSSNCLCPVNFNSHHSVTSEPSILSSRDMLRTVNSPKLYHANSQTELRRSVSTIPAALMSKARLQYRLVRTNIRFQDVLPNPRARGVSAVPMNDIVLSRVPSALDLLKGHEEKSAGQTNHLSVIHSILSKASFKDSISRVGPGSLGGK